VADAPDLSIVVASWSSDESLERCLSSLAPQCGGAEVIVATNRSADRLEARYPQARFLSGPERADVPILRRLGADASRGRLVAFVEDHAFACPGWAAALREAHGAGFDIIGGPVENALRARAVDWALYWIEYGAYMPPMRGGPVPRLSGLNVAYDRELLLSCREIWKEALFENEVNGVLCARGHSLHLAPDAVVESHLPMTLGYGMRHLHDGGRRYSRYRASRFPFATRVLLALASPLVPAVLFARLVRAIAERRPARFLELARALPFLALLLGAWGWGEAMGYVASLRGP
jgi:glycosyltransferase involved in cell wall biosynthesis